MLTFAFGVILGNFTAKGLEISKFPFVLTPDSLVTSSWLNLVLERLTDNEVLGYFQLSIFTLLYIFSAAISPLVPLACSYSCLSISASIYALFFTASLVFIIKVLDMLPSSALV